jgi:glutamate synthase (NADPH/NADH) large chain
MKLMSLLQPPPEGQSRMSSGRRNDNPSRSLNDEIVTELVSLIEKGKPVTREFAIRNTDRSVPVQLSYYISKYHGTAGLPEGTINLVFKGTAGQSFGAFTHNGIKLTLIGDANDYAGKGMHGGIIVIRPDGGLSEQHRQVIVGNTVLYGATGGAFFAAGMAGERFAVRNSGTSAVVEGTGQHLCEYMTRGEVAVLGETGINIGAGMTGGVIYIADNDGGLDSRINGAYVKTEGLDDSDIGRLKSLIEAHHAYTSSPRAAAMLSDFDREVSVFKKVVPK